MLTPDERAVLIVYCHDHPVAVCPQCAEVVTFNKVGTDSFFGQRDFCPACRADLTDTVRAHLRECTWIRVQTREARERAQEIRRRARETAKESEQLRDQAEVLAREAEEAQRKSRDVRRGQPPGTRMSPSLAGVRIIVVESHQDLREMLGQSLRRLGATVLTVTTAREAVVQIHRAEVIVTDVVLPGEDGVWLCERVNLQLRPIPVIGMTAYTAEQYPRLRRARFARTLLKPVDPGKLADIIAEVLARA